MIGQDTLKNLLESYGINADKLLDKNQNVIDYGYYNEIKMVLDYLIKEKHIPVSNIEKAPSVLFFNPNYVKENYEFLESQEIPMQNVNNCLHILSSSPLELKETYHYVKENYGLDSLNRVTSILSRTKNYIQNIELIFEQYEFSKNESVLSAAIHSAKVISGKMVFELNRIKGVVETCRQLGIKAEGTVFLKTAEEIKKIAEVCNELGIKTEGTIFLKTAEEIKKIAKYVKNWG